MTSGFRPRASAILFQPLGQKVDEGADFYLP